MAYNNELTMIAVGLETGGSEHVPNPSSDDNISTSNKFEENVVMDQNTCENVRPNDKSESDDVKSETETRLSHDGDVMRKDCDETGEEFSDEVSVRSRDKQREDVVGLTPKVNSTDQARNTNTCEDEGLLSEISELVDHNNVDNDVDSCSDQVNLVESDESKIVMETIVEGELNAENSGEYESPTGHNEDENSDIKNNTNNVVTPCEVATTSELKKPKESAVQRLANLGLIADEKPVVEDKETILKKLASRGGISIMPAGSTISSASSVKPGLVKPVSIKQTQSNQGLSKQVSGKSPMAKPAPLSPNPVTSAAGLPTSTSATPSSPTTHKPGPKSAKKKIKIDPGKSLDIDKDFNSLINFLSAGSDVSSTSNTAVTSSTPEEKGVTTIESVSENVNENLKPDTQLETNEASNHSTADEHGSGMDVDTNDDKSFLESESESHDGSKFEHSSENDEKTPLISKNKNVIEEGSAEILLSIDKNVFYNKVQEFNRDMSIAALTVFSEMHQQDPRTRNRGKKRKAGDSNEADSEHTDGVEDNGFEAGKKIDNGITILEALSATGLRSIRYAREIPGVKEVIANDLSEDAVDTIRKNVEHNSVGNMVTTSMSDASLLMYQKQASQEWYDAVDLDPYGCPARFLDAAVQAVRDGGLLLVTCTDMAILAGNAPETCYVKYGAVSLRMPACHEMALRIALQCIESHANRYGRYIVPLLSFSADFYIRLIVQVYTSPVTCKRTTSKLAMVYQCCGCGTHSLHPLGNTSQVGHNAQPKFSLAQGPPVSINCFHCSHKHHVGGPIWTAPLYSPKFVESMLKVVENGNFGTAKRMQGMLEVIREELPDVPLYYTISGLCSKLHCQAIPLIDIRSAILNAGYRVSSSHAAPTAVKTNAPAKIIWDILRCWVHMNPVSQKRLVAGSVSAAIILEPPNLIANFDIHPRARPSSATRKLVRYQQNPEKNWGPGTRARCNNTEDSKDEKRRLNQNKSKNKKHIDIIEVVTIDDEDEITEESKTTETPTTPSLSVETE